LRFFIARATLAAAFFEYLRAMSDVSLCGERSNRCNPRWFRAS
jgi:hypothetical protein